MKLACAREQMAAVVRSQLLQQEATAGVTQAEHLVKVSHVVHLEGLVYIKRNILTVNVH